MSLTAPRKREREHAALRGKIARAKGRLSGPDVPVERIVLALLDVIEAVEELRALVERSGGR